MNGWMGANRGQKQEVRVRAKELKPRHPSDTIVVL
jgi:hypothetical protein